MCRLSILGLILILDNSHAYESMTRKGYANCIACHYSPRGGGLLTDYGKLVGTSDAYWKGDDYKEGSFKKAIRLGGKLDHGIQFRLANIKTANDNTIFPMQADYLTAFQGDNWTIVSQLAKSPSPRNSSSLVEKPGLIETLFFRELKLIFKPSSSQLLSIGRERQNLGLRLADHTHYNKSLNRFNVTDLTTSFSYDYILDSSSFSTSLFIPSYQESENEREFGGKFEYRKNLSLFQFGLGFLYGNTQSIDRFVMSLFGKMTLYDKFYVFSESVFTKRETFENIIFGQKSHLIGLSYYPIHSLELFIKGERVNRESPFELLIHSLSFGLNKRFFKNLTARFDFKRNFFEERNEDILISQLFLNGW